MGFHAIQHLAPRFRLCHFEPKKAIHIGEAEARGRDDVFDKLEDRVVDLDEVDGATGGAGAGQGGQESTGGSSWTRLTTTSAQHPLLVP